MLVRDLYAEAGITSHISFSYPSKLKVLHPFLDFYSHDYIYPKLLKQVICEIVIIILLRLLSLCQNMKVMLTSDDDVGTRRCTDF